jgi:hypothetical protein
MNALLAVLLLSSLQAVLPSAFGINPGGLDTEEAAAAALEASLRQQDASLVAAPDTPGMGLEVPGNLVRRVFLACDGSDDPKACLDDGAEKYAHRVLKAELEPLPKDPDEVCFCLGGWCLRRDAGGPCYVPRAARLIEPCVRALEFATRRDREAPRVGWMCGIFAADTYTGNRTLDDAHQRVMATTAGGPLLPTAIGRLVGPATGQERIELDATYGVGLLGTYVRELPLRFLLAWLILAPWLCVRAARAGVRAWDRMSKT